jgi:hypothetical protein
MKFSHLLLTATAMTLLTAAFLGGCFGKGLLASRGPRQIVSASAANVAAWHAHNSTTRYASTLHYHLRSSQ